MFLVSKPNSHHYSTRAVRAHTLFIALYAMGYWYLSIGADVHIVGHVLSTLAAVSVAAPVWCVAGLMSSSSVSHE